MHDIWVSVRPDATGSSRQASGEPTGTFNVPANIPGGINPPARQGRHLPANSLVLNDVPPAAYPRHPRHPRCNQQEFQISSGTKPKIPFLQCHFHLRRITHITTDLTDLMDNMRGRYLHKSFPYPRHPLREFTPCAPGRSNPFYSLLIAHRLIGFATDRMDVAESVTGPSRGGYLPP